jgi:hypothetical protein
MSFSAIRCGFAVFITMLLATIGLAAAPAQAAPAPLTVPVITFPDGTEAAAGSTLTVTFDAGGDRRVTAFRYSLGAYTLDLTAVADRPGGTATVALEVGTTRGSRQLFAAAADRHDRISPSTQASIFVVSDLMLDGVVLDGTTWLPVEGAVVTLQPGGYQATSDADGLYEFRGVPTGEYTVQGTRGGDCPAASYNQPLLLDGNGLTFRITLYPLDPDSCLPVEPEYPPATIAGFAGDYSFQPIEGGATVTLEPLGLQTTTDEAGGFVFTDVKAGTYTLTATANTGCWNTPSGAVVLQGSEQTIDLWFEPATC